MDVLDDYKFRFGELMNKAKTLAVLFDHYKNKEIEGEIEHAVSKVFEKHNVDLDSVMTRAEDKYPEITKVYSDIDKNFHLYKDTVRFQKVDTVYNKITETLEKFIKEEGEDPIKAAQFGVEDGEVDYILYDSYMHFLSLFLSHVVYGIGGNGDITESENATDLFTAYLADSKNETYMNH
jgi:hypothetical protein